MHDFKNLLRMHTHSWEESLRFLFEYRAELHSHLRSTSQSHTPAALELPLRECYSVLNVSDVLEYSR